MPLRCLFLLGLLLLGACSPSTKILSRVRRTDASALERSKGCPVGLVSAEPTGVRELGWISVNCGPEVPEASCERALLDEACGLGADVVWGKQDISKVQGRSKLAARAGLLAAPGSPTPP